MKAEDVLRQALAARVERVEPAPGAWESIQARVGRRARRGRLWSMSFASLATGVVATVAVVALGLTSCLPSAPVPPVTTNPPVATGPTTATGTPPTSTPPVAAVPVTVPVYFTADVDGRAMLYREFRHGTVPADSLPGRIQLALSTMLSGRAMDPDYAGEWPPGSSVRSVRIEAGVAVVDLAGAGAATAPGASAALAVQELVYTVTAVAGDQGVALSGVRLLLDGARVDTLWDRVPVGGLLVRGPALDTLAPVWIISPQQDDTVGRTFEVHLAGAVFEAAVTLRVRDRDGVVVQSRTVTLSAGAPGRGEARVPLTLDPGQYTVEAFAVSPKDGRTQYLDDHVFVVSG